MNKALLIGLIVISSLLIAKPVSADIVCQPLYGGGQSCVATGKVTINKQVQNPQTGVFVDNLGPNDPKFVPGQTVPFRIILTNTGNATLSRVTVKDIFPVYVQNIAGPGSFNANTLTFDVFNLNPSESRTFDLNAQVIAADQLPNKNVICEINNDTTKPLQNRAIAIFDGQIEDDANFCIEKQAVGGPAPTTKGGLKVFTTPQVTKTPPTGPETIALLGLIPTGALGLLFRKYSTQG